MVPLGANFVMYKIPYFLTFRTRDLLEVSKAIHKHFIA